MQIQDAIQRTHLFLPSLKLVRTILKFDHGWNFCPFSLSPLQRQKRQISRKYSIIERVKERRSKLLFDFIEWKLLKLRDKGRFDGQLVNESGVREEFLFHFRDEYSREYRFLYNFYTKKDSSPHLD